MPIVKPTVLDGGNLERQVAVGDILAGTELVPATIATTNITVTGAILAQSLVLRSAGGASVETIDTAANIVAALTAGLGLTGIENGTSWRVRWVVSTAFAHTLTATANTGITVTNGIVNASSCKDFLVQVLNGTPARTVTCSTTNGSAVVTGLTDTDIRNLSVGMTVTNVVAGMQGFTIIGINAAAKTVTMSGNATSTGQVSVSFSPRITITGIGNMLT